jgi:hypothetical protein
MASTVAYYINLTHRADRRQHIEQELARIGIPAQRISAVYEPTRGILGCGKSHILALETFLQSGATYAMIFEDDFTFALPPDDVRSSLRTFFAKSLQWDVLMLAGNILNHTDGPYSGIRKVLDAQTTSGYMITRAFAPRLLQNLKQGVALLESHYARTGTKKHEYCLDIYWKSLQPSAQWFVLSPKVGYQMESYSDIEQKQTNYGV